ncbi:MAG TPA: VTT domain-containing protein [Polyangia bacterium]|jgi:phosphatidylserine/phosphatidylglycerophosphate/cardiolipin synthase-like enzyme/uncharacterized membrane protein YdjX (TVP38/TMEM64 family)
MSLLVPGATCWKTARARHVSLIQDAGPAFAAIAAAMEAARDSIFILGWDIDSRTPMRPEPNSHQASGLSDGGGPLQGSALLPLLLGCLARHPGLQVFILIWDYAIVYSFEREPRPRQQFGRAHPRLHFALDADHASGGSHHQKIVVVDDEVAFLGGIDLTMHRWDQPRHLVHDPRRIDGAGAAYPPFHDVHAAVAGPAAAALGELARARWQVRRGRARTPAVAQPRTVSAWPAHLAKDASDIEVGFARTYLRDGQPAIKEIEALTRQAIAAARGWIYAENQYLTSHAVVRQLASRLVEANGPDIAIVLPEVETGWMERGSMGLLRERSLAHLRAKDLYGRLRLVSPRVTMDGEARDVGVHAKVLVIDDTLVKIGSANFSNRSMGLDTECDLAVEASDDASAAFIASVRNRLLGEHLGLTADEVAGRLVNGGLCLLLDGQPTTAPYSLVPVPDTCDATVDLTVFDGAIVDPEEPWSLDALMDRAVPVPLRRRLAQRWLRPLALAIGLVALWALFRHGPLRSFHLGETALRLATELAARPAGPFLATAAIALAGALFIPITLLGTTALAVFGVWPGVLVAWTGGVLAATLSHTIGARWGTGVLRWLPGKVESNLRRVLRARAFWSVVFMRLLPLGNFGALNLLAGAFKIPRRTFVLGNMVGMAPGLLGLGVFVNRALAALRHPSTGNVVIAVVVAVASTVLTLVLKRRLLAPAPEPRP